MSFYLAPNGIDDTRLKSVIQEIARGSKKVIMSAGPFGWLWADDDPERFGPAVDDATGVIALSSGRLAWSTQEWSRARKLNFSGGLANRLILERYLSGGASAITPYNGAAAVAIHDPKQGKLHVWTDQFGYHPCFLYRPDRADQCIVTTFPDALLGDPSVSLTDDVVSMAEFVRAWRATPPHTYFEEVKHANAGTLVTIDINNNRISSSRYWRPFEDEFYSNIDEAAEDLAESVRVAIRERTAIARRPLFFISGGSDSRVLLFSIEDRANVTAVNLYEREAEETRLAAALCDVAGCRFVSFQRDNDFYPRTLTDTVRWSGAMWSAEDSHYTGFSDQIDDFDPDFVMTACTVDWVFKGYGLEKRHLSVFGKNLPILGYTNRRAEGFLPNVPMPAPARLGPIISERLESWFSGCPSALSTPRERLIVEDRRIRPTSYTVSVSGSIMYRRFPYDTFLADSRVAECYSRTHPDWKLNRELWGKAASRICKGAGSLVDANYGWRIDAGVLEKLVVFGAGWIGRRMRSRAKNPGVDQNRPPSSGSWPDYGWYALHSNTATGLWNSANAEERERLSKICTTNPWAKSLREWSLDGQHFFRLLTLLTHWRETAARRSRVLTSGRTSVQEFGE